MKMNIEEALMDTSDSIPVKKALEKAKKRWAKSSSSSSGTRKSQKV